MTTDEREARALRLALVAFDKAEVEHLTGALAKEYTRIKTSCEAYTAAMTEGMVLVSREDAEFSEFMLRRVAVSENDSQCFDVSDRLRAQLGEK